MIQSAVNSAIGSIGNMIRMRRIEPIITAMANEAKASLTPEQEIDRRAAEGAEVRAQNAYNDALMNGRDADSVRVKGEQWIANGGRSPYFGDVELNDDDKAFAAAGERWQKSEANLREHREWTSTYIRSLKEKGKLTKATYKKLTKAMGKEDE